MELTNKAIRDLIIAHKNDETLPINPLSMKINGIVDPAVMGGFSKYEEAFLTEAYLAENPKDEALVEKLKELIASQIPLMDIALAVHKAKAPQQLNQFHDHLEKMFAEMQQHVEQKYGKRVSVFAFGGRFRHKQFNNLILAYKFQTSDLKFDRDTFVTMRRQSMMPQISLENRLSETSMGSTE